MSTLKEAIEKAANKKRKRTTKKKINEAKFYEVKVEFCVKEPQYIKEFVRADSPAAAFKEAKKQFDSRSRESKIQMCLRTYEDPTLCDVNFAEIKAKHSVTISSNQLHILNVLDRGHILLKNYRGNYSTVPLGTEVISPKSINVDKATIAALRRKGLIVTPEMLLDKEEYEIQKALGSLPPSKTLVLNPYMVKECGIHLNKPKKIKAKECLKK